MVTSPPPPNPYTLLRLTNGELELELWACRALGLVMLYLGIMLIYITSQFSQLWMLWSIGLTKSIRLWLKDIFSKIQHNYMVSYLYQNICFRSMESKGFSVGADQRVIFGDNFRSALDHSNTLIQLKLNCHQIYSVEETKTPSYMKYFWPQCIT